MSGFARVVQTHAVVWFRNDLRLLDNLVLQQVIKDRCKSTTCVFCFDSRHFSPFRKYGGRKTEIHRANFLLESVADLRSNLQRIGLELVVALDFPENVIPRLLKPGVGNAVYFQAEDASEEARIEAEVRRQCEKTGHSSRFVSIQGNSDLYPPHDTSFRADFSDVPNLFTSFRTRIEQHCKIAPIVPIPAPNELHGELDPTVFVEDKSICSVHYLPRLQCLGFDDSEIASWRADIAAAITEKAVMTFEGGESAAWRRIQSWMFAGDNLKDYFDTRNGMLGEAYSSKLSPWLALGCVSPRAIAAEVKNYESRRVANKSTYWLLFELIWRDYFRYVYRKYKQKLFMLDGACGGPERSRPVDSSHIWRHPSTDTSAAVLVDRWKRGLTGYPLIDANMRELLHTGFMSNRGRQNVASFLIFDLKIDWRVGAHHFESLLIDSDVYSNYGNWNAAAGLLGGRINKFNILKQSKDYDPDGKYIKSWVPELAHVPVPELFEPWKLATNRQWAYKVVIGTDYPSPITAMTAGSFSVSSLVSTADWKSAARTIAGSGSTGKSAAISIAVANTSTIADIKRAASSSVVSLSTTTCDSNVTAGIHDTGSKQSIVVSPDLSFQMKSTVSTITNSIGSTSCSIPSSTTATRSSEKRRRRRYKSREVSIQAVP